MDAICDMGWRSCASHARRAISQGACGVRTDTPLLHRILSTSGRALIFTGRLPAGQTCISYRQTGATFLEKLWSGCAGISRAVW
ncbi:hypothetical protein KCP73_21775 [Salmonella enterica subsp. enterica]|nr:hypothetical protein KCP73_21775 [Salmonella enterica subsp. enterica]